jgi:predicted Zn finger-like uncharacterized protein
MISPFEESGKTNMRLTCPNCDAQYEVPDEVMPTAGRDVQCSNCGQTWFQHHPDHAPDDEEDAPLLGSTEPDPDEEVSPPPPPQPPAKSPERRQLDPAVADILRQEAEAEHAARKREPSGTLETQADLGLEETASSSRPPLDDTERRTLEAKRRMARMRGEPDPVQAAALAGPRRELLPDIEEINSTLRNDSDRGRGRTEISGADEIDSDKARKGGFGRGFMLMLLLVLGLALVYAYAPQIAQAVPQVDPYLSGYVGWVDGLRVTLDGLVKSGLMQLDSIATQVSS